MAVVFEPEAGNRRRAICPASNRSFSILHQPSFPQAIVIIHHIKPHPSSSHLALNAKSILQRLAGF
jgi:hypothetical protein